MKTKTSELTGDALDWAVATCEGYTDFQKIEGRMPHEPQFGMFPSRRGYGVMELWELSFSTDWNKGGWIIERERIELQYMDNFESWSASMVHKSGQDSFAGYGKTPLVAAMRCYVASKLGDEVELPEGLI